MKKTLFIALIALFFVPTSIAAQKRKTKSAKPAVYSIKPPQPLPPPKAESNTFGLSYERYLSNYEVKADGTGVQTAELLQRFNSLAAVQQFGQIERLFNADLEDVEIIEAYLLKKDGKKIPVAADKIQISRTPQAEAAPAFSSLKTAKVEFDGAAVGDAAFCKLKVTTKAPIFAGHFNTVEALYGFFDWKSVEINLIAPANYPLYTEAIDLEGSKLPDAGDGKTRWQWRKQNFAARPYEAGAIGAIDFSPRLAVTSFKNYDELGAAYWADAKRRAAVTPEVQKLADEITKNIADPREQAAAIYLWANKNIRYLSIVLGRGGWVSHSANEILANGYGDCKDYTTLLQALLAAKKIESYPVLVRADGPAWFPSVPAAEFFNHAILYIPSLDLFADATAPNTRLGLIPQVLVGKSGFLGGERTGKITIPAGKPEENQLLSEAEVTFTSDGSVRSVSKNSYVGRAEMVFRPLFADSRMRNSEAFVPIMLAVYGVNGTGKLLNVSDPHRVGESFDVEAEINLGDYTTFLSSGKLNIPPALTLHNPLMLEMLVAAAERKNDLTIGAMIVRQTYKLRFPEKVQIAALPPVMQLENALGSYRSEFQLTADAVLLTRELIIKKDVVTPPEYPVLRELIKKAVEDYNSEISYTADRNLLRDKSAAMKKQTRKLASTSDRVFEAMMNSGASKKLTARQAVALETRLKTAPNDVAARQSLITYYSAGNPTPARRQTRMRHALWLIQNHPQFFDETVYYNFMPSPAPEKADYQTLKDALQKKIDEQPNDARIRINAVNWMKATEPEAAETLLRDGRKIEPENFLYSYELANLYGGKATEAKDKSVAGRQKFLSMAFAEGEQTLILLKKERSDERDEKRAELLKKMAEAALELNKLDKARIYATELVLEFGDNPARVEYSQSSHYGNLTLGKLALKENAVEKAKEHLLIAARAPQRARFNSVSPDFTLAAQLLERGEQEVVLEYVTLCEKFTLADKEKLQTWREEIKAGKTPTF